MLNRVPLFFLLLGQFASGGLERYPELVVSDSKSSRVSQSHLRVTYLGTNGYQIKTGRHALLIDPYFSRVRMSAMIFNASVRSDSRLIKNLAPKPDAILVTHGHVDHLLDAPVIMQMTGARLVASHTAVELAEAAGAPPRRSHAVTAGNICKIGPWNIRVLAATHDRVFPIGVPFPGPRKNRTAPRKAGDWVCGEPLAFLIESHGKRIYVEAGGTGTLLPPANIGRIDLAILGVALPDSRARFAEAVRRLRPRYILPSHQDNFFRPLNRGFAFGPLTDFPRVLRDYKREQLPGQLILLDYFRPWTLP
jgi:L-ascorbate metabolism protein UlaG (beta-lactamase superfamily)